MYYQLEPANMGLGATVWHLCKLLIIGAFKLTYLTIKLLIHLFILGIRYLQQRRLKAQSPERMQWPEPETIHLTRKEVLSVRTRSSSVSKAARSSWNYWD